MYIYTHIHTYIHIQTYVHACMHTYLISFPRSLGPTKGRGGREGGGRGRAQPVQDRAPLKAS